MTTFSFRKRIYPGQAEYLAAQLIDNADVLEVELEENFVLDDLILSSSGTIVVKLSFLFPMSGLTAPLSYPGSDITVTSGETWFLNEVSATTSKRWYPLPAKTKFRLEVMESGSDNFLQCVLIGRPG